MGSLTKVTVAMKTAGVKSKSSTKTAILKVLPWLLMLAFLVIPMISSAAFLGLAECEPFGTESYLRIDYSTECLTAEHRRVVCLSIVALLLYPVGLTLVC